MLRTYSMKSIPTMNGTELFTAALTDLTFTIIMATFVTIVIELPCSSIWRVYCETPLGNALKKISPPRPHKKESVDEKPTQKVETA